MVRCVFWDAPYRSQNRRRWHRLETLSANNVGINSGVMKDENWKIQTDEDRIRTTQETMQLKLIMLSGAK